MVRVVLLAVTACTATSPGLDHTGDNLKLLDADVDGLSQIFRSWSDVNTVESLAGHAHLERLDCKKELSTPAKWSMEDTCPTTTPCGVDALLNGLTCAVEPKGSCYCPEVTCTPEFKAGSDLKKNACETYLANAELKATEAGLKEVAKDGGDMQKLAALRGAKLEPLGAESKGVFQTFWKSVCDMKDTGLPVMLETLDKDTLADGVQNFATDLMEVLLDMFKSERNCKGPMLHFLKEMLLKDDAVAIPTGDAHLNMEELSDASLVTDPPSKEYNDLVMAIKNPIATKVMLIYVRDANEFKDDLPTEQGLKKGFEDRTSSNFGFSVAKQLVLESKPDLGFQLLDTMFDSLFLQGNECKTGSTHHDKIKNAFAALKDKVQESMKGKLKPAMLATEGLKGLHGGAGSIWQTTKMNVLGKAKGVANQKTRCNQATAAEAIASILICLTGNSYE